MAKSIRSAATLSPNLILTSPLFFFSSRRRHTRSLCDWSSDVCSRIAPCAGGIEREHAVGAAQRGRSLEVSLPAIDIRNRQRPCCLQRAVFLHRARGGAGNRGGVV